MHLFSTFLTSGLLLLGTQVAGYGQLETPPSEAASATIEAAVAAETPVVTPVEPTVGPVDAPVDAGLAKPVQVLTEAGMAYLPKGFHPVDGGYDVVIHFHGAPGAVEGALDRVGLNAALLVMNLGIGSGAYEDKFADETALDRVLPVIERTVAKNGGFGGAHVRRIALSAWSAGYGAVVHVLSFPKVAARIDAVLLADGMHAAYERGSHRVDPLRMVPFTRFAHEAKVGGKLMAISHSAIDTMKYASTTETSAFLLADLGVRASTLGLEETRGMVMTSRADANGFHVEGFAGGDASAHCQHLLELGETLYPFLADRWNAR